MLMHLKNPRSATCLLLIEILEDYVVLDNPYLSIDSWADRAGSGVAGLDLIWLVYKGSLHR